MTLPTTSGPAASGSVVVNVPNVLTAARLVLSVVVFALLERQQYAAAWVAFVVAASTDWLDGYYARKYQQVTTLGRILDPFVDKIIVCGTFVYLAVEPAAGVRPWMAVLILGRELLVTALRSFLEQQGADFSAQFSGKLKMLLQCVAAGVAIAALAMSQGEAAKVPEWLRPLVTVSVWAAVAMTVISGVAYIRSAVQLLRR